jgi:uncharacterized membrane protein
MAERTEGTIEIAAPQKTVMDEIADFESYTEWSGNIKSAKIVERDAQKRGKHVAFVVDAGPLGTVEYTLEYSYHPNDGGLSWTWIEGKGRIKDLSGEYVLAARGDDATHVTYRMELSLAVGFPIPGFVKRQAEKLIIDVALKGLKKRVESRG